MGRKRQISDTVVLAAARTEFSRQGHAASTRRIAKRAGISQATLFQRFGGKDKLFVAATSPMPLDVEAILGMLSSQETAVEHVTALAVRLHDQIGETIPLVLHLAESPLQERGAIDAAHARLGVPAMIEAVVNRLNELKTKGKLDAGIDSRAVVDALLLGIHGLVLMRLVSPHDATHAEPALRRFVETLICRSKKKGPR